MDEDFGVGGWVDLDDEINLGDVEASGCDVGGEEDGWEEGGGKGGEVSGAGFGGVFAVKGDDCEPLGRLTCGGG